MHRLHIDFEGVSQIAHFGNPLERSRHDSGVVDEDIETSSAEFAFDLGDSFVDTYPVRDGYRDGDDFSRRTVDEFLELGGGARSACREDDRDLTCL